MSSIVLRAGGTRPAPPALAGAVHEATRSGAGMRMEEAQVKLRSSDCAVFFHMWFATKCHEEKYGGDERDPVGDMLHTVIRVHLAGIIKDHSNTLQSRDQDFLLHP